MSKRKGFKRLAIALGIPWFGWWGFVGVMSYRKYEKYRTMLNSPDTPTEFTEYLRLTKQWTDALDMTILSVFLGIVVPLTLAVLGAFGLWIYRGFKSEI